MTSSQACQRKQDERPAVLVVAGPTAAGKSGLALALAREFAGTVINADSMQVYRDLKILTARPGAAEMATAPHRLYGVLDGAEACSAGRWRSMALAEIEAALSAVRLPILVGGTGLYLRALIRGLAPVPAVPAELRREATRRFTLLGGPAFHAELAARDPVMAARLRPSDKQRLIRAWEVVTASGRSLAQWQAQPAAPAPYRFASVVLLPPRALLYQAADRRFQAMLAAGALTEVEALVGRGLDPALPVMKSLGVAALADHLAGALDLSAATARGQRDTRRYAKRQLTWLRHQFPKEAPQAAIIDAQFSESICPRIFAIIREFGLTLSA